MAEVRYSPAKARLHLGRLELFDGTVARWPAQGEAHLKQLIERSPNDPFLYNRLGNLYKAGDADELALETYQRVLELDGKNLEAFHSIAEIHVRREEPEVAASFFHRILINARVVRGHPRESLLRELVLDTLIQLSELHEQSGGTIPIYPTQTEDVTIPRPPDALLSELNPEDEASLARLAHWLLTGNVGLSPPRKALPPPLLPRSKSIPTRVGRNDPCPCGSGKKHKKCCLARE
jgi:hypothetical protein